MKKLLLSAAFAIAAMSASAATPEVVFSGLDHEGWTFGQNATVNYVDGHAVVEMGVQSTDSETGQPNKWRADMIYNAPEGSQGYKFNPLYDKIFAVKFIGGRPQGNLTFEVQNPDENKFYTKKNSPSGTITTAAGNTIVYYDLSAMDGYNEADPFYTKFLQVKIADNTVAPHAYTLDWIKVYESVDALDADKNWKDDGVDDADDNVKMPIVNKTSGAEFGSLEDAFNAAVEGDEIVINRNVELGKRLTVPCKLTISGASKDVCITRTFKGIMLLVNNDCTFENITIASTPAEQANVLLEVNKVHLYLNDVIVSDVNSSKDQGIIAMKQGGKFHSNNVTFVNCSATAENCPGFLFLGTNGQVSLDGLNDNVSVTLEKTNAAVSVGETFSTAETPVAISYKDASTLELGTVAVNGTREAWRFTLVGLNDRYLVANPDESANNLIVTDSSAVEAVAAEAAPAEYFDLNGRRVANPVKGLYIVRQGNNVSKVVL